jgi:integrase/recombinase XerD
LESSSLSGDQLYESLPIRKLLEVLLGPDGRRRLALREKTNDELFGLYHDDLVLRLHNAKNLKDTLTLLTHFGEFLGAFPPSSELAKSFLARYADYNAYTLYRYTQMVKAFMKWYGEPLLDVHIKIPKSLPDYTEDLDIEKLLDAIGHKKSHKGIIERDRLLVEVALKTGLRRAELASLKTEDIYENSLIVRQGKGKKDRMIPLTSDIARKLHSFIKNMKPGQRVFGLGAPWISMKVKQFAKKAGLTRVHTHALRHKFATDLLESGVDIKVVQTLLGHANLNTTEVYLSLTDKRLYDAIKQMDDHKKAGASSMGVQSNNNVFQTTTELVAKPMPYDPTIHPLLKMMVMYPVTLGLQSNAIQIDEIQIHSSDLSAPYKFMLFESDPNEKPQWEQEDMIQMEEVQQRVFTFSPSRSLSYVDQDNGMQLHCGIGIFKRPIRFNLPNDPKIVTEYYDAEVRFNITLRYKIQ